MASICLFFFLVIIKPPSPIFLFFSPLHLEASKQDKTRQTRQDKTRPASISIFVTRGCADMAGVRVLLLFRLVQVRVQRLGGLGVVVARVDDILRVAIATVVLLRALDVCLALAS